MASGPSGKNVTPRRQVSSEHWEALDTAARHEGDATAVAMVRRLISETLTDTSAAIATCKRIRKAVSDG